MKNFGKVDEFAKSIAFDFESRSWADLVGLLFL